MFCGKVSLWLVASLVVVCCCGFLVGIFWGGVGWWVWGFVGCGFFGFWLFFVGVFGFLFLVVFFQKIYIIFSYILY
ncbi:MAG: hypothetical protein KIH08_14120 [Candidatus Freyarchaeota archaeon]|nr:hypothetical protein [Candidatus Jordarchaeia archaeon]MBS7270564.1 hypothetical protein [Candidatus Jordarchaeia archaeon]MBS7281401.1 hypothetical protein [Candidatus Jordarchaeia archaeon]